MNKQEKQYVVRNFQGELLFDGLLSLKEAAELVLTYDGEQFQIKRSSGLWTLYTTESRYKSGGAGPFKEVFDCAARTKYELYLNVISQCKTWKHRIEVVEAWNYIQELHQVISDLNDLHGDF